MRACLEAGTVSGPRSPEPALAVVEPNAKGIALPTCPTMTAVLPQPAVPARSLGAWHRGGCAACPGRRLPGAQRADQRAGVPAVGQSRSPSTPSAATTSSPRWRKRAASAHPCHLWRRIFRSEARADGRQGGRHADLRRRQSVAADLSHHHPELAQRQRLRPTRRLSLRHARACWRWPTTRPNSPP